MIIFEDVSKTFPNGFAAVKRLSLHVKEGETLVLLGTSGSGKTTTMKMVNRLLDPTEGSIQIYGADIMKQDPIALRRKIGYAIQDIGLFPHMTVAENIGVVPNLLSWSQDRIRSRIDELLGIVGLSPEEYRDRYPSQLSGGQRQRIGVARALAADPPVILMDEPFGALDPITREQLQNEFLDLESEIKKTILFVTHDIFEAVKMADRIALLHHGQLQQVATPSELVESPANAFVDDFLGRHRFQLSLLTKTLQSLVGDTWTGPHPFKDPTGPTLSPRASVIDALDLFKITRSSRIGVRHREKIIGYIEKPQLHDIIHELLNDERAPS